MCNGEALMKMALVIQHLGDSNMVVAGRPIWGMESNDVGWDRSEPCGGGGGNFGKGEQ